MPPVNWMVPIDEPAKEQIWLPTDLMYCPECQLVQLDYIADSKVVFPDHYPYTSGSTKILRDNFTDLAREVSEMIPHKRLSVCDIGSNDGTLLQVFRDLGHIIIGVEPTDIADIAMQNGIPTVHEFFNIETAKKNIKQHCMDVVTCCNCFAHMPDPNEIVEAIKYIMKPDGMFVSENHYLIDLLDGLQYDTIYHEHLRYYSLRSLDRLLSGHGMSIIKHKHIATHGGSIRVYAKASEFISKWTAEEPRVDEAMLTEFAHRVLHSRRDLISTVHRLKTQGRVVGIGAPSRASTVINYCRLDVDLIDYVAEKTGSLKIGRYMPGTRIPVVDEQRLIDEQPEAAIIFSHHIADEIETNLRAKGYKSEFVRPI
jgi:SAM-dependent methyltransferase